MRCFEYILYIGVLFSFPLWAQKQEWHMPSTEGFSISISLSDSQVSLGHSLLFHLNLQYPLDYQIDNQQFIDHLLWQINPTQFNWAIDTHTKNYSSDSQSQTLDMELHLTPLALGTLPISLLSVTFISKDLSKKQEFLTPIFEVEVIAPSLQKISPAPLLPLTNEFPIDVTLTNRDKLDDTSRLFVSTQQLFLRHTFPWVIPVITLLCGMAIWLWKYWERYVLAHPHKHPSVDPREEALQALYDINTENLLQSGLYKEFYEQLVAIVRRYFAKQLNISTTSFTTEEFIDLLSSSPIYSEPIKGTLTTFLAQADHIKFARYQPSLNECKQSYQTIHRILINKPNQ